ncbi:MAG TPA: type II toxin-antitoxin system HicA family toxin [Candidatus Rifleibacterium sp.]|jgi:predicted RNA binding protein YcfA (HicA-like mRNA interferase family)|nr:type II toxin-antitoxin system HicA family toxin [Candidatus Rifleibacterium sp.]HNW10141.1 type II toxin-antitoxin system HicA family toxin [Candidatus Rifleibacterium sp.]HOI89891.1 type II toxin-antitoxin system HicA family toxin [Candidatus Rifleibacterium sp.]
MRPKELIKILEAKGWKHERTSGSHQIMTKPGKRSIPIPFHGNKDFDPKFIRMIEKQTGEKII